MLNGLPCFFSNFSFAFFVSFLSLVVVGVMLHYLTTVIVVVCDVLEPWVDWQVFTVQQAYHLFIVDGVVVWRSERKYPPHDVSVFFRSVPF